MPKHFLIDHKINYTYFIGMATSLR